jgi:glycine/D-amino acid oxidase-like deaminating enzyme
VPGVASVESVDHRLIVGTADPATVTPSLVRTLVAAGADIVEVRERATTLEEIYFEVMGVRPDHGEAA